MGCCTPESPNHPLDPRVVPEPDGMTAAAPELAGHPTAEVPGGSFAMGDAFAEGYPADGELPVHQVSLDPFAIDLHAVTNSQFAAFAGATGYRTESERFGYSAVFHLLFDGGPEELLHAVGGAPWWLTVRGADWRHPAGSRSDWRSIPDHPVVQVSWHDAMAYCRWAGRRLPTEAEWEFAARGGLAGARYPWGDELCPGGKPHSNIWQGTFPSGNTLEDGYLGTAPAHSFPANGLGLRNMAGNVWEWCADWFSADYYAQSPDRNPVGPESGIARVMRGGSYLCHASYCNRYRVAARSSNTPDSASGNLGFRTVAGQA